MAGLVLASVAQASEADFLISGYFTTTDCVELILVYGTKLVLYRILNSTIVYIATTQVYGHPIAITSLPGCIVNHTNSKCLDAITIFFPDNRLVIASASTEGQFRQLLLSQIDNHISLKSGQNYQAEQNNLHSFEGQWNNYFVGSSRLLSVKLQEGAKKLYSIILAYPLNYLYVLTIEFGNFIDGDKSLNLKGSHLISISESCIASKLTLPLMVIDSIKYLVDEEGIIESGDNKPGPNVVIKSLIIVYGNIFAMLISHCPEKIGIHSPEGSTSVLFFSISKVNGTISLFSVRNNLPLDAFNLISQSALPNAITASDYYVIAQCHDRLVQINPYTISGFDIITSKFYLYRTQITFDNSVLVDLQIELELYHIEALSDCLIVLLPLNSYNSPIILINLIKDVDGRYSCQNFISLSRIPFYANIWHKLDTGGCQLLISSGAGLSIYTHLFNKFTHNLPPLTAKLCNYIIPADITIFDAQPTTVSMLTYQLENLTQTSDDVQDGDLCPAIIAPFIAREIIAIPMIRDYLSENLNGENKMQAKRKKKIQVRIAGGKGFEMAKLRSKEADPGAFLAILGPSGVAQPTNYAGKCNLIGVIYPQIPLYLVVRIELPVESIQILNNTDTPQVLITSPNTSSSPSVVTIGDNIRISKYRSSYKSVCGDYLCKISNNILTIYEAEKLEGVFHCKLNSHLLRHSNDCNYPAYSNCNEDFSRGYVRLVDPMDLGYTLIIATEGLPIHIYRSNTGRIIDSSTTFSLKLFDCIDLVPGTPITISQPLKLPNEGSIITISAINYYLQLSAYHNDCYLHRIKLPQFPSLRVNDGTEDIFSDDYIPKKSLPIEQIHPINLNTADSYQALHLAVSYLGIDREGLSIYTLDTITKPIAPFNDWTAFKQLANKLTLQPLITNVDMPYQLWNSVGNSAKQLSFDGSVSFTKVAVSIRCYYLSGNNVISAEPMLGSVGKLWALAIGKAHPISELLNKLLDARAGEQIDHLHSEFGSKITTSELIAQVEPHSLLLAQLESLNLDKNNGDINEPSICKNAMCESFQICVGHLASQGIVYGYYELPPFTKVMSISFGIVGGKEMLLVGTAQASGEIMDCIGEFYILDIGPIFNLPNPLDIATLYLVHKRQFSGPVMSIKPAGGDIDWPGSPYYNFYLDILEERNLGLDASLGTVYLDEVTNDALDKESKSSIHAVVYSDQFLHSAGSRLFVHEVENGTFIRGAFGDMPFCVTDICMIDNFIVAGDVLKGVGLFMYRHFGASNTRAICRVASTNISTTLSVLAVSATVCNDSLAIIASDSQCNLHLLSFSLEKAQAAGPDTLVQDKITSSKLITLSVVHLHNKILHLRRFSENINYSFAADGSVLKIGIYAASIVKLFKLLEESVVAYINFPMGLAIKPLDRLLTEESVAVNLDVLKHFVYMPSDVKSKIVDKIGIKKINASKWTTLVAGLLQ